MRRQLLLGLNVLSFGTFLISAQTTLNTPMASTTVEDPVTIEANNGFYADASSSSGYVFLARIGNLKYNADYKNAPNSYIYVPSANTDNDGIKIPVKKAFDMWKTSDKLNNQTLSGTLTATVYWQDVPGLVRSASDYTLGIEEGSSAEWGKIKVPIDKGKGYGNAVVALHVGNAGTAADPVVWSWHIWVTDDPTNGSSFGHTDDNGNRMEFIGTSNTPASQFTPKFMDRNLGAIGNGIIGKNWHKAGGLMFQWGRKDPFPPLIYRDGSYYEVSGEIGNIKSNTATQYYNFSNNAYLPTDPNSIKNNIANSIRNPLKPIYNTNTSLQLISKTWFAGNSLDNLWSDNAQGNYVSSLDANGKRVIQGYKIKSPLDPCPNKWRIPSMLTNNPNVDSDNLFLKTNPFGQNINANSTNLTVTTTNSFLKPTGTLTYYNGIKVYPRLGFDFSGVSNGNIGKIVGTGYLHSPNSTTPTFYYDDTHETRLWTATITNNATTNPINYYPTQIAFAPDASNTGYYPDSSISALKGWYTIYNNAADSQSMAACRCIEDPYSYNSIAYKDYDFPVDVIPSVSYVNYTEGLNNPNSYLLTKSNVDQPVGILVNGVLVVGIPISKAFSMYNQYLSDHQLINFNNLKVKVYWSSTSNGLVNGTPLIKKLSLDRQPTSVDDIKNVNINVTVAANQSGNALISLHDGDVNGPALWSWHVWVTNDAPAEVNYTTEDNNLLSGSPINFEGFTNSGYPQQKTIFMDRNLGAIDAFPTIQSFTNGYANITGAQLQQIKNSGGMQYQWGRKDPLPPFITPGVNLVGTIYQNVGDNYVVLQSGVPDASGNVIYSTTSANNISSAAYSAYSSVSSDKYLRIRDNLKYAVNNPFTFLFPSTVTTNANDWILDEINAMPERWGHASSKSPFDPCPDGWRVPDEFRVDPSLKGTSPWYNGKYIPSGSNVLTYQSLGVNQFSLLSVYGTQYGGKYIRENSASSYRYGSQFDNPNYYIGNIPMLSYRGTITSVNPPQVDTTLSKSQTTGFWTAALSGANDIGKSISMIVKHSYNIAPISNDEPFKAMNVRCVKIDPVNSTVTGRRVLVENKPQTVGISLPSTESLYPNPTSDYLNIDSNDDILYQIYDMSGKLVSSGRFIDKKINVSSLSIGSYLIRLTNYSKNQIKTKVFIKN